MIILLFTFLPFLRAFRSLLCIWFPRVLIFLTCPRALLPLGLLLAPTCLTDRLCPLLLTHIIVIPLLSCTPVLRPLLLLQLLLLLLFLLLLPVVLAASGIST